MSDNVSRNWNPYRIPTTPSVSEKSWDAPSSSGDPYVLSPKNGANSSKNPSGQVEWSQIPINDILNRLAEAEAKITEINDRLNTATIEAECVSGDVTVTLNL